MLKYQIEIKGMLYPKKSTSLKNWHLVRRPMSFTAKEKKKKKMYKITTNTHLTLSYWNYLQKCAMPP